VLGFGSVRGDGVLYTPKYSTLAARSRRYPPKSDRRGYNSTIEAATTSLYTSIDLSLATIVLFSQLPPPHPHSLECTYACVFVLRAALPVCFVYSTIDEVVAAG
jgi:hypothetical protein